MNRARVVAGILLISAAVAAYSLGYATYVGEIGTGTVTIYPAAAIGLVGVLTLWSEFRRA